MPTSVWAASGHAHGGLALDSGTGSGQRWRICWHPDGNFYISCSVFGIFYYVSEDLEVMH